MKRATHAGTGTIGFGRILVYAGMVVLVSVVANAMFGISESLPILVPMWGIAVAGTFLYFLAQHERIPDMSGLASRAVLIDAHATNTTVQPETVYAVSSTVTSDTPLADLPYHNGGDYLALERFMEEFRRQEGTDEDTLSWEDANRQTVYVAHARIGSFTFTPDSETMSMVPLTPIPPDPAMDRLIDAEVNDKYLYRYAPGMRLGKWTSVVGDERFSYKAVPSNVPATLIGVPQGNTFVPYVSANGMVLHNLFLGSLQDAVATLRGSYTTAQRRTRIAVAVVEIIAWTVLLGGLNVGAMLGLGSDESAFIHLALGIMCGIASVVIVGKFFNPRK